MKSFKKKGALTLDTVLIIVVAILVILLVLYFIYNNVILDWIGNLPSPEEDKGDKLIDLSKIPEEYRKDVNLLMVAMIRDAKKIHFCKQSTQNIDTPLEQGSMLIGVRFIVDEEGKIPFADRNIYVFQKNFKWIIMKLNKESNRFIDISKTILFDKNQNYEKGIETIVKNKIKPNGTITLSTLRTYKKLDEADSERIILGIKESLKKSYKEEKDEATLASRGYCRELKPWSKLWFKGPSEEQGEIYVSEGVFGFSSENYFVDMFDWDDHVATVRNGKVDVLDSIFSSTMPELPPKEDLRNLDGSYFQDGILYKNKK